ncbi:MAG: DbpA RNA binding domain-containing protein, partial [Gemmatimonadaceae bacterium]|nr:DbpA RNA binding domain-containing protein [Gemmatimonadaceae bacterium]
TDHEEEIPTEPTKRDRASARTGDARAERSSGGGRDDRSPRPREREARGEGGGARAESLRAGGGRSARGERDGAPAARGRTRAPAWDVARLYIGAGRLAKVRPADLVGAIANEVGIDASAIGAIQIADRFSIVEVPDEIADDIIAALRETTIKGRQVLVRRDRA